MLGAPETLVAFESPRRVAASLAVLASIDPERPVAVCRELTKLHEEVVRGTAAELAARYADAPPRGEVVLVVGPAPERTAEDEIAPAVDAVRAAGRGGRQAARRGGGRRGADRRAGEHAVPGADGDRRLLSGRPASTAPPARAREAEPPCPTARACGPQVA